MSSDRRRRVGILGGTFDPPHVGHLALARSARDAMQLDEVRLMPTGHSWQKSAAGASALQRLEMVRIALRDVGPAEGLRADDREVVRGGQTYTVDTLEALRKELGPDVMLVLIVGSDQLRNLATWRNWHILRQPSANGLPLRICPPRSRPRSPAAAVMPSLMRRRAASSFSECPRWPCRPPDFVPNWLQASAPMRCHPLRFSTIFNRTASIDGRHGTDNGSHQTATPGRRRTRGCQSP